MSDMLGCVCAVVATASGVDIPQFTDRTIEAGLTFVHASQEVDTREAEQEVAGLGVGDFDRDGFLDLFVAGGQGQNAALFINDGAGHFTNQADAWGIDLTTPECSSVTIGDADANGYLDIYVGTIDGRNALLMNTGQNRFVESGERSGAALINGQSFNAFGATFGDVDFDADLDLVTVDWRGTTTDGNRLFMNLSNATFVNANSMFNVFQHATGGLRGFTPTLVDMNDDNRLDLLVVADFRTGLYYAAQTDMSFQQLDDNGTGTDENGMGSAVGDYDNDGDPDWFVTSIYDDDGQIEGGWGPSGNRLYRNEGDHQFTDVTEQAGVRDGGWGWGASMGDMNHDGLLDIVMVNGYLPPGNINPDPTFETDPMRLWLNTGEFESDAIFEESSQQAGLTHTAPAKGLVCFDADNDGDLDMAITTTHGPLTYYRNDFNPPADRWLEIDLVPPPANAPDGIGSKVQLVVNGVTYTQWVFANPSYMSSEPLRLHFGFPSAATIDSLTIRWPNCTFNTRHNIAPGQVLTYRVGDLDDSGLADTRDWAAISTCITGPTGGEPDAACADTDLNVDQTIDLRDAWRFQQVAR